MAECIETVLDAEPDWKTFRENYDAQIEEVNF